jgi:MinD-like ATPase involved in chromosome partitioning or flagellar assembly
VAGILRINLLIATIDVLYAKLLSDNISEHHSEKISVSICSSPEGLQENLYERKYNVALLDAQMMEHIDIKSIHLPLLLWSETEMAGDIQKEIGRVAKYQRISSIVAAVLEQYAKLSSRSNEPCIKRAKKTAVWSPVGGVGKTSVAMAYALSKTGENKEVFYLNLEHFTSLSDYFNENGKSISTVFEMLENREGDVKMLIQGLCCKENGITYLCAPDNFDDMCILSSEDLNELITACSEISDELVIDLSCVCDARTKKVFDLADNVMLVAGQTTTAEAKMLQFISQSNTFENIKEKVTFIANKGTIITNQITGTVISFPHIQSNDARGVCKALSERFFV